MIVTEGQGVIIEKLRKFTKEIDGEFGWQLEGWGCYSIVICFLVDAVW